MSFDAARKVINTSSIGFSCLEDFNDPFECTSFGFKDADDSIITAQIATNACRNRFSRKYGVLSLTRQPLNSLMWSHYGNEHRGVVIGFDMELAGLSDVNISIIPSQYGEVIYSATKPHKNLQIISEKELMSIGEDIGFDSNTFNLVKRAFLYKSSEWAYEEEVRVVKNISKIPLGYHFNEGRYDEWTKIFVSGRPLYCLDIPRDSIKEIYLGRHIYKNVTRTKTLSDSELKETLLSWGKKDVLFMQCEPDIHTWNLDVKPSINKS